MDGAKAQEFRGQDTFWSRGAECCQLKNAVRCVAGNADRGEGRKKWNKLTPSIEDEKHEGSEEICTKSWYIVCSISHVFWTRLKFVLVGLLIAGFGPWIMDKKFKIIKFLDRILDKDFD